MKKFFIATVLGLLSVAGAHAATRTVPTAESCVSYGGNRITNVCGYGIEVNIIWSSGSTDLEELGPGRSADTTNFGADTGNALRWFACPNPSYTTTTPGSVTKPNFYTSTFWCQQN